MPPARPLHLLDGERRTLTRWARRGRTARLRRRARIILHAAAGHSDAAIARALHTSRACVARWRARFRVQRVAGLADAPHPGRPPSLAPELLQEIVTLSTTASWTGVTPWSTRRLARQVGGVSPKTIHRVWQATGLTPQKMRPLRLRRVGAALQDCAYVVGRYLTPEGSALVLGRDAEARRPPALRRGAPARESTAWPAASPKRLAGVPARYADLHVPTGNVIGFVPGHSELRDWLAFLRRLAARIPVGLTVHVLADNGAIHQHPAVQRWVEAHPAVRLHLVAPEWTLPARLRGILRRVEVLYGEEPPRARARCWTLRAFVEAFSPPPQPDRMTVTWVGTREMITVFCGGVEDD